MQGVQDLSRKTNSPLQKASDSSLTSTISFPSKRQYFRSQASKKVSSIYGARSSHSSYLDLMRARIYMNELGTAGIEELDLELHLSHRRIALNVPSYHALPITIPWVPPPERQFHECLTASNKTKEKVKRKWKLQSKDSTSARAMDLQFPA